MPKIALTSCYVYWIYGVRVLLYFEIFSPSELQQKRKSCSNGMPRGIWNRRAAGFKNSSNNGIIGGVLELELAVVQQQIKIRFIMCSYKFYIKTPAILQSYKISVPVQLPL